MKASVKKKLTVLCMTLLVLFSMTGCSLLRGDRPVVTIGGAQVKVGQTTPNDLRDFNAHFGGSVGASGVLPAGSWLVDSILIDKNDTHYARVRVYNATSSSKSYTTAPIFVLSFNMHSEEKSGWAEDNALVNGIDFCGMTSDDVKDAMADYELNREDEDGSLHFHKGDYRYSFTFTSSSGFVDEVKIEYDIF